MISSKPFSMSDATDGVLQVASGNTMTTAVAPPAATVAKPTALARITALDYTKGVLVVLMVLYHWLNYFVSGVTFEYRYIRFITPSFIFITGFFVSHIYFSKYSAADSTLPKRLFQRGLKILALFMGLNAVISLVLTGWSNTPLRNLSIYLSGNSSAAKAAYSVLVPIGYLLILCAALVIISRVFAPAFTVAAMLSVGFVLVLGSRGITNTYLELLSMGLLGVTAGYVAIRKINDFVEHTSALLLGYVAYILAITLWSERFTLQIVGVYLSLALIYLIGRRTNPQSAVSRAIILLGQYSLLGYIAQILILQLLQRGMRHVASGTSLSLAALVAGIFLTYLTVVAVDRARGKARVVNKLYTAVFS